MHISKFPDDSNWEHEMTMVPIKEDFSEEERKNPVIPTSPCIETFFANNL